MARAQLAAVRSGKPSVNSSISGPMSASRIGRQPMRAGFSRVNCIFSDIRRMAAGLRMILRHFGFADKPEPRRCLVDGRRARPTPCPGPNHGEFSLIDTHLSCEWERTHDNRTPYGVAVTDGEHERGQSNGRKGWRRFLSAVSQRVSRPPKIDCRDIPTKA